MDLPHAFDVRALRIFVAVVDAGGMTAAARRLGMTQSTVSQAISNLEEATGAALFDRTIRPIALTNAGAILHDKARAVIAAANDAFASVRATGARRIGSLTIAMAESFANTVGPRLVHEMVDIADRWRIWSGISPDHQAALLSHAVDMIVTTGDELDAVEGLERHPIVTEPFVLVFAKGAAPSESPVDLARLTGKPFVRYSLRSSIGRQIERQLTRMRLDVPIHAEFDTATGQLTAVADGMGWSITTPLCLAQEQARLPGLTVAPLVRGRFSRNVTLVARAGELGDVPSEVAAMGRSILERDVFARLFDRLPWLGPLVRWP
ncbi:LysR family transcriptional regulator [Acuticoccus sp. M5D2P5]|uniref:LysR family transcriptional regulator n=1 Tax=Acuticoccus kalidii TaxID=2910977 RepID=UPI001F1BF845|nr:LysR family transcriptional regulator [Acuticoccus kalidii]MCF3932210.1 LysR family transcriptional regulator [Acuticoccus kalidii]